MRWIETEYSPALNGTVVIPGSKNSAQALAAAACLADEPVTLQGMPALLDFVHIYQLVRSTGAQVHVASGGSVTVDPRSIQAASLDIEQSSSYRAAYYFAGALLAKVGQVSIGYPGGDDFGSRPIEQHFKGFRALGAEVSFHPHHYTISAPQLSGAEIYFDIVSMGATINLMMAASRAKGTTVLRNAAHDPEVVDVANLLNLMGARIRGAGTPTIRIEGVDELHGCEHRVIPDRLIAGTMLFAAAATTGRITVDNVIPEHLSACVAKLREMNVDVEMDERSVTASAYNDLKSVRVLTTPYPGFPTDLQQPLTAAALRAQGRSLIIDTIYTNRFQHVAQLNRMGADIVHRWKGAVVHGGKPLQGAYVHATDVRAGACLILAGLQASGTTHISGIEHLLRGFEDVVSLFRSVGARIQLVEQPDAAATPSQQATNSASL